MARKTLRRLIERSIGREWDRIVRRIRASGKQRVLICWNRGLGDVALGVYPLLRELRRAVPGLFVAVLTRAELAEAFLLLDVDELIVDPELQRRDPIEADATLRRLGIAPDRFAVILQRPDPTHWFHGLPAAQPRLRWPADRDRLGERFGACFETSEDRVPGARGSPYIGVHLQSETGGFYGYRKDWRIESWRALFADLAARHDARFVLFGHRAEPAFEGPRFVDLRGRTSLFEMLALIKNRCRLLIAPDSGVLTLSYYLDVQTPIDVVSLWADPRQGVLKQGVPSPNPYLRHRPLVAPDEDLEKLDVATVASAVDALLADDRPAALLHREEATVSCDAR